jgi:hypothetical protein
LDSLIFEGDRIFKDYPASVITRPSARGCPTVEIPGSAGVLAGNAFGIRALVTLKNCNIGCINGYSFVLAGEDAGAPRCDFR